MLKRDKSFALKRIEQKSSATYSTGAEKKLLKARHEMFVPRDGESLYFK